MEVEIIKSKRRTISISVNPDLTVTVRAPWLASKRDIERVLKEKESWVLKTLEKLRKSKSEFEAEHPEGLSAAELKELARKARLVIPARAEYYAKMMGVNYNRITIRTQKTRWGSCSRKRNLNFNCLLLLTPPEVLDYVVVHELCHIKEMNHSRTFWDEVQKVIPDYKSREKWLKTEGHYLIHRLK